MPDGRADTRTQEPQTDAGGSLDGERFLQLKHTSEFCCRGFLTLVVAVGYGLSDQDAVGSFLGGTLLPPIVSRHNSFQAYDFVLPMERMSIGPYHTGHTSSELASPRNRSPGLSEPEHLAEWMLYGKWMSMMTRMRSKWLSWKRHYLLSV